MEKNRAKDLRESILRSSFRSLYTIENQSGIENQSVTVLPYRLFPQGNFKDGDPSKLAVI